MSKARKGNGNVRTTLGELIAAAFEAVNDKGEVARLVSSEAVSSALGKRIVVV